ncbi:MFS transporter [Gryllotalpicola daejeonensis]|uniref:MFS transporter n=1 Tax=Gryllotalpicola daejeonensis TaxID=993087 RepID=A0ABP7ZH02_9MICO
MAGFERGTRGYRRMLAALFLAGIATFAQLYAPQAVLPLIARSFRVGAADSALSISAATVGLAIGVIPWSLVADRIGRPRAMSAALVGATVFGALAPLSPGFPLFLAGRVLEGLFIGGVPALAIAYLSDEIASAHTARAAGTYVAGTTIGGLLGRIVAGPVADLAGWRAGVLVVVGVCACATAGFIAVAPRRARAASAPVDAAGLGLRRTLAIHLRSPRQLALYAQAFLLMGGFVAMYNYLGFRLERHPFSLRASLIALVFLAYLAGTWSSAQAGALSTRLGRRAVLLGSIAVMVAGVAVTLSDVLWVVLAGLVIATAGFFGAHAIASGWTGHDAAVGRGQAAALYNLAYYAGSSVFGWLGGIAFGGGGWPAAVLLIGGLAVAAAAIALTLPRRV